MSTTLIWRAFVLMVALIVVFIPLVWWIVPRWKGHRRWGTEDLRLKSESEMRRDAVHAVLGIGALFSVLLSVATYVEGREKENAERKAKLVAQLGDASVSSQTDALRQLSVIWKIEEPTMTDAHVEIIRSFLQTHAQRQYKPPASPEHWKPEDLMPVERNRPAIEAAFSVLSQLNKDRARPSGDRLIVIKDLDLRDLDLRHLDFHGVDFSSCVFIGSTLRGCSIDGSKLFDSWLIGADLSNTVLDGSDLSGTHVGGGTDFSGASIAGADFRKSTSANGKPHASPKTRGTAKNQPDWEFD